MTKRWSSTRSMDGQTKRQASKSTRRAGRSELDDWRQAAGVEAGLRREFLSRAERAERALREIIRIEKSREIPDRHGRMVQSCNETCLCECAAVAETALNVHLREGK